MKFYIKYILLIIFGLLLTNCTKNNADKTENVLQEDHGDKHDDHEIVISKEQFDNEGLVFGSMEEQAFPDVIKSTGMIDVPPSNRAIISAHIGGYVKNSPLLIGDVVKKGQLLLSIENIEFLQLQQEFLEAAEQLNYLKSEYERQSQLYQENISSKKSFLKAESLYNKTKVRYIGLKEQLKLLNIDPERVQQGKLSSVSKIYAPIEGDITNIEVNTGMYVSPSDHIMEIVDTHHIHLELKIFEKDALNIKKGQQLFFRLPESSAQSFKGEIHLIGRSIGKDRSVKVHAHIEDESVYNFIPGMFVQADIVVNEKRQLSLPENAVVEVNDTYYALLLKSENNEQFTFEKKQVIIGKRYNNFVEIINADTLSLKAKYVIGGFNLIKEEGGGGHSH